MIVCRQCLMAIESHEGYQRKEPLIHTEFYDEEKKTDKCEWCEEEELVENIYVI